jgi:hypothetical protein
VRFLRHLGAVTMVVAAVVLAGLAWNHFAASSLTGGLRGPSQETVPNYQELNGIGPYAKRRPASRGVLPPRAGARDPHKGVVRSGGSQLGLGSMFEPANLPYLRHTVVIETAVIAGVVILDVGRRRSRRARRAWLLAADQPADADRVDTLPGPDSPHP